METTKRDQLRRAIEHELVHGDFYRSNGRDIKGQAISQLLRRLHEDSVDTWSYTWGNDFDHAVVEAGFQIVYAKNSRNQDCRVVTW